MINSCLCSTIYSRALFSSFWFSIFCFYFSILKRKSEEIVFLKIFQQFKNKCQNQETRKKNLHLIHPLVYKNNTGTSLSCKTTMTSLHFKFSYTKTHCYFVHGKQMICSRNFKNYQNYRCPYFSNYKYKHSNTFFFVIFIL